MPKIVEFGRQFRITLPLELVQVKGWRKGMLLRFVEDPQGNVLLKAVSGHEEP